MIRHPNAVRLRSKDLRDKGFGNFWLWDKFWLLIESSF